MKTVIYFQGCRVYLHSEYHHVHTRQRHNILYIGLYGLFSEHKRRQGCAKRAWIGLYHVPGSGAEVTGFARLGGSLFLHVGGLYFQYIYKYKYVL